MTKIEPVAEVVLHNEEKTIDASLAFFDVTPIGAKLYSEAQMRQLGEACAAVCDDDVTVERIRELVKEMLG